MSTIHSLQHKILKREDFIRTVEAWKIKGASIVFTNGCFDILHKGHVFYLAKAAEEGSFLVVGLNSDDSVKRLEKGKDRPVNHEDARAMVLASLQCVDAVCIFDEDTPLELIKSIQPNVIVKGGDYDANISDPADKKYIVGSAEVKKTGGKVVVIDTVEGYSTTSIINKMKS